MKLATIDSADGPHPAVLLGEEDVLDLARAGTIVPQARLLPASVRDMLEVGEEALDLVRRTIDGITGGERDGLRESGALAPFASVALCPPIPDPRLILSAGLNYRRHLEEMSGTPVPTQPTAFIKAASSLTGSGKPILVPPQCPDMIDFEGEFTFVFGRACHDVPVEDAMSCVAGYTICNDVSARDWVGEFFVSEGKFGAIHTWERNIMGKQLPSFTPSGPVMVTADEIADPHDLQLTTTLNGTVMQSTKTDDLIFGVADLVSYFSKWYRFQPGDIVTTGSPSGVGFGRDPKVFMKPGDLIEVEVEGVGRLSNRLEAT